MKLIIQPAANLPSSVFKKLIPLIGEGGQIPDLELLKQRIIEADFIAMFLDGENIATTATLKNPIDNYKNDVFQSAESKIRSLEYSKELGYIVTNPDYKNQKLCQKLLTEIMPQVLKYNVFATTRKAAMAHILKKWGFQKEGKTYKGDLELYITPLKSPLN